MPKRSVVWLGLAVVVLCGCLLIIVSSDRERGGIATPAWAASCFRRPVKVSSSDLAYIGLTVRAAQNLAAERGQRLLAFGADYKCLSIVGVAVGKAVAIAFDTGSNKGIPVTARVVFASSDAGLAMQGL